jgi:hypothetical protein
MLRTCVQPDGIFKVGVHKPSYQVKNLRKNDHLFTLGHKENNTPHDNTNNFPQGDVSEENGRIIYEIANAFAFCGATFIDSSWAASRARDPVSICIASSPECSLRDALSEVVDPETVQKIVNRLPKPLLYDLAANSTDPDELILLAKSCSRIEVDAYGNPTGLVYKEKNKSIQADIDDFELFETIANNPYLPDIYKEVMVLRPGVQGNSEIVGDWQDGDTHVFEYLRRNSYIPWGHFAANMAHDAIRYATSDLTRKDIQGLRHLYYQRMVVTLADQLKITCPAQRRKLTEEEIENLRLQVLEKIRHCDEHPATLWGWNFGYDFSGSGYRLHASHQMIHQQFAMVLESVELLDGSRAMGYSCGDQVAEVVEQYSQEQQSDFFSDYIRCIRNNSRPDNGTGNASLIVWEDENVMLFAPKAQVSQWELQLMVLANHENGAVGNVLEAETLVRHSIDTAILLAQRIYAGLGAKMVTSIEYSKRMGISSGQRLLYAFLPKLPWSMGAFSEAQQRYICGHFAEDFAYACRKQLPDFL